MIQCNHKSKFVKKYVICQIIRLEDKPRFQINGVMSLWQQNGKNNFMKSIFWPSVIFSNGCFDSNMYNYNHAPHLKIDVILSNFIRKFKSFPMHIVKESTWLLRYLALGYSEIILYSLQLKNYFRIPRTFNFNGVFSFKDKLACVYYFIIPLFYQ